MINLQKSQICYCLQQMLLYRKITRIQSVYTQFSSFKLSFIYTEAHDSIHLKVLSGLYAIERLFSNYLQSGKKKIWASNHPPPFFFCSHRKVDIQLLL